MTERDEAWKRVFDRLPVAEALERGELFSVSAEELKAAGGREPRLMAKIDTLAERPAVLAEHGAALFPVRNGRYVLFPDPAQKSFHRLEEDAPAVRNFNSRADLESFDTYPLGEASESQALDFAFLSGLIPAFCGDEGIRLTLRGRLFSGDFRFATPGGRAVEVSRVQIEVDGGYESPQGIYLIEAKRGRREDFHVRQLWYPFLNWSGRSRKRIVPIFFTFSNGQYYMTEFAFGPGFGEIEPVKSRGYFLEESPRPELDLHALPAEVPPGTEPEGTFPQANDLDKVVDLAQAALAGPMTKAQVAEAFDFDERQGDYYGNAACYLGIMERADGAFKLTPEGEAFAALRSRARRTEWLARAMLRVPSLRAGIALLAERNFRAERIAQGELAAIIRDRTSLGASTPERRASTLRAWLAWLAVNVKHTRLSA